MRAHMENISDVRHLLNCGKRDEAIARVKSNYSDWRRKNLAKLYNQCGDAKFYGAGFWIARLVAPDCEVENSLIGDYVPRRVEQILDKLKMPYQVITDEILVTPAIQ